MYNTRATVFVANFQEVLNGKTKKRPKNKKEQPKAQTRSKKDFGKKPKTQ